MANNPEKTPFQLRGHHVRNVGRFRTTALTPEEDASRIRKVFERGRRTILGRYAKDLVGNTREEAYQFESGMRTFLTTVKELPEDHPVELIAGKPDGICKSCAVGHHCSKDKNLFEDIGYNHAVVAKAVKAGHKVEVTRQGGMITSAVISAGTLFEMSANLTGKDHLRSLVVTYIAEAKKKKIQEDIRTRTFVRESHNNPATVETASPGSDALIQSRVVTEHDLTPSLPSELREAIVVDRYLGEPPEDTVFQRYGIDEPRSGGELPRPSYPNYHTQVGYEIDE